MVKRTRKEEKDEISGKKKTTKKREHQWASGTPPAPEDHTLAGRLRFTRSVL